MTSGYNLTVISDRIDAVLYFLIFIFAVPSRRSQKRKSKRQLKRLPSAFLPTRLRGNEKLSPRGVHYLMEASRAFLRYYLSEVLFFFFYLFYYGRSGLLCERKRSDDIVLRSQLLLTRPYSNPGDVRTEKSGDPIDIAQRTAL